MTEKQITLGRTAEGYRVTAEIRLERKQRDHGYQTVEHESIAEYLELGITFSVIARRFGREDDITGGQVSPENRAIVRRDRGDASFSEGVLIDHLWEEWHLNGVTAGCAHMDETIPDGVVLPEKYGQPDRVGWRLANLVCPETGYRWGHSWLVRPLPTDVIESLATLGVTA